MVRNLEAEDRAEDGEHLLRGEVADGRPFPAPFNERPAAEDLPVLGGRGLGRKDHRETHSQAQATVTFTPVIQEVTFFSLKNP